VAIDSRTYILDRIKSRKTTIEEFNFDKLTAPPIAMMFTQQDIQDLYYIAHSIKLSAHPEKKLQYINDIMSRRGFVKFIGGTNRISYRPIEDNSFLVKVAIDDVGRSDNPREFKNQHALKPFVTKVFEVSPCGTLGVFERVVPITNRQEFMSVSEDVFTLINEWLIGEYVMDDIGSNYFMNYGIRKNFGVVLLDYPYMHKVDYNKLFCALEDKTHSTKSGLCEGEIDYDDGYNKLVCKKCGAIYKAIDLAKAIEDEKIIIKGGKLKMSLKINISGGSKNSAGDKTVEVNHNITAEATPSKSIVPSMFVTAPTTGSLNIQISRDTTGSEEIPTPELAVNGVGDNSTVKEDKKNEKIIEEKQPEKPVEEECISNESETATVDSKESTNNAEVSTPVSGEIISPIEIHEEGSEKLEQLKKEAEENLKKVQMSMNDSTESADDIFKYLESCPQDVVVKAITKYIEEHCYFMSTFNGISEETKEDGTKILAFNYRACIPTDDDKDTIEIMDKEDFIKLGVDYATIDKFINESGIDLKQISSGESYNGFYRVAGKFINMQDIDSNAESYKVIVLIDENGNYLTDRMNNIIAIEIIDNKSTANLTMVSTQWFRCAEKQLKELENVKSNQDADNDVKEAPVGAVPVFTEDTKE